MRYRVSIYYYQITIELTVKMIKPILIALFISNAYGQILFPKCEMTCTADDEFEGNDSQTPEWEQFSNLLVAKTFENYTKPCPDDESIIARIGPESNFLWDLRFRIYDKHVTHEKAKTLSDCYCNKNLSCDSQEFRECITEARNAMIEDLDNVWDTAIQSQLDIILDQIC